MQICSTPLVFIRQYSMLTFLKVFLYLLGHVSHPAGMPLLEGGNPLKNLLQQVPEFSLSNTGFDPGKHKSTEDSTKDLFQMQEGNIARRITFTSSNICHIVILAPPAVLVLWFGYRAYRVPTPPPPLRVSKAGKNHLNEEITTILPTRIGE